MPTAREVIQKALEDAIEFRLAQAEAYPINSVAHDGERGQADQYRKVLERRYGIKRDPYVSKK